MARARADTADRHPRARIGGAGGRRCVDHRDSCRSTRRAGEWCDGQAAAQRTGRERSDVRRPGRLHIRSAGVRPLPDRSERAGIPDTHDRSDVCGRRRPRVGRSRASARTARAERLGDRRRRPACCRRRSARRSRCSTAATLDTLGKPDVLEALRLIPGVSLVQSGARGGVTSVFVRGGNSNFNKVLDRRHSRQRHRRQRRLCRSSR